MAPKFESTSRILGSHWAKKGVVQQKWACISFFSGILTWVRQLNQELEADLFRHGNFFPYETPMCVPKVVGVLLVPFKKHTS